MVDDKLGSELGKKTRYDQRYNPERLHPIARLGKRQVLGIASGALPFFGFDRWNHYEVSWLNAKGKPRVATAEIIYDCASPFIIESKSLKLYFNSLNHERVHSSTDLEALITRDLEKCLASPVIVRIAPLNQQDSPRLLTQLSGECLDDLDIECSTYTVEARFLSVGDETVEETVFSDLLKSNCLVTGQPDFGSVQISYKGRKINHEGLLKYLVSYRNHAEFHEQCIERIFVDLLNHCRPDELTIYGCYTRRGGLDINPYRSTQKAIFPEKKVRLIRQ